MKPLLLITPFLCIAILGCANLSAQNQALISTAQPTAVWDAACKGYVALIGLPAALWFPLPALDKACPLPPTKPASAP